MTQIALHNTRLWRAINPRFISNQLYYIKDHLAYDQVIWDYKKTSIGGLNISELRHILRNFSVYAAKIDITGDIQRAINLLGTLIGTTPRAPTCSSIYTPWRSLAPDGKQLQEKLLAWQNTVIQATPSTCKAIQWQLLLQLEGLMIWEQYNGFLAKLLWNLARSHFKLPLAIIPFKHKELYYHELLIFSDALIAKKLI